MCWVRAQRRDEGPRIYQSSQKGFSKGWIPGQACNGERICAL
jgi:hypothetical protein